MDSELIVTRREAGIGRIVLNRPQLLNAIDIPMLLALESALIDMEDDTGVRVVVITGAGDKAFLAGGDIRDLNSRRALEHYEQFADLVHRVFSRFEDSDKPNIAAVNGYALGGGMELILATDIRFAAETARLGLTEINLGLFPGGGGTQRLPRQVPSCVARELMFSGRHITAAEAQQVGIINRVVPKEQLDAEVDSLARTIASKSALALKFLKRTIRQADEMHLSAGLAYERSMISLLFESADAHEGCSAFLEKRKPKFTGQ